MQNLRKRATGDSGVAMLSALLLILIASALSILVLGIVVAEVKPTLFAEKNSSTIFAAETGVNAALTQVRSAAAAADFTGAVYGDKTKLACTANGTVNGTGTDLTYSATIRYFSENPAGKDSTWRTTNALLCVPGSGTSVQPSFAAISSQGLAHGVVGLASTAGNRTIEAIYQFELTNVNIAGGLVYSYGDQACLQSTGVAAGSTVTYVALTSCGTNDERQLWIYDTDYTIKLASTIVAGSAVPPLCITGPTATTIATEAVSLQPCVAAPSLARWNQLWSWEGGARWVGENEAIANYSSYYLSSGTASGSPVGRTLTVSNTSTLKPDKSTWGSFDPDPRVGPGAASVWTHQITNYLEFGRCFDVTKGDVNWTHMIVYPCKQDPSPGGTHLSWNHRWYYSEPLAGLTESGPQQIYILKDNSTSQKYCLEWPALGVSPAYAKLTASCSTTANNQKWTRRGDTGVYATSYNFVDNEGRCASLGGKFESAWSIIVMSQCDGGPAQKWNAPPAVIAASVDDYREVRD